MPAHPRTGNVLNVPTDRTYAFRPRTSNILAVFDQASVAELDEGLNWYREAHALAVRLNPSDPIQAAGVIAALSPITPWERNVNLAIRAYEDGYASGSLGRNCTKADQIMAGNDPLDVLKGDKVRAFFNCIAYPETSQTVCVDRHAFDIAHGRVTNDATRAALGRKGAYDTVARAYVRAADALGYGAPAVQAVTWTVWRRLKGL